MKTYVVVYQRDEAGWWVATVKGVPGCHTQGKSIEQARRRIREALEAAVPDAGPFTLKDDIRLPRDVKDVLARRNAAQARFENEQARAQALTKKVAMTLIHEMELSVRDAGVLLGLSHQRVQQLIQRQRE